MDGVIARRVGVATPRLREWDSRVDGWFCLWIAASAWVAHRDALMAAGPLLLIWLGSEALSLLFDWLKFRRFAAYHTYGAKLAGALLFAAMFSLFALGDGGYLLGLALLVATLSHIERIAITAVLPCWTPDVPGLWSALRKRSEEA